MVPPSWNEQSAKRRAQNTPFVINTFQSSSLYCPQSKVSNPKFDLKHPPLSRKFKFMGIV